MHPRYSHACTRFPFLALLTRFSVLVEDGEVVLIRRFVPLGSGLGNQSMIYSKLKQGEYTLLLVAAVVNPRRMAVVPQRGFETGVGGS